MGKIGASVGILTFNSDATLRRVLSTWGSRTSQGIDGNRYINNGSIDGSAEIYRSDISPTGSFYIYSEIKVSTAGSDPGIFLLAQGYRANHSAEDSHGYGININFRSNSGNVVITDAGTILSTASYAFNSSDTYAIDVEYTAGSQNWVHVYIWDISNSESKPNTPTLSFTNGSSNYTPTASGVDFIFHPLSNTDTVMYADNYEVGSGSY